MFWGRVPLYIFIIQSSAESSMSLWNGVSRKTTSMSDIPSPTIRLPISMRVKSGRLLHLYR